MLGLLSEVYLGKTHQVLHIRNTFIASSVLTNLILNLQI